MSHHRLRLCGGLAAVTDEAADLSVHRVLNISNRNPSENLTIAWDWVAAWRPSLMASEARTPSLMLAPTLARDGPMQLYAVVNASCRTVKHTSQ